MRFRVTEKTSQDDGKFVGYELEYGSWLNPRAHRVNFLYKTKEQLKHDICMILQAEGKLTIEKDYI